MKEIGACFMCDLRVDRDKDIVHSISFITWSNADRYQGCGGMLKGVFPKKSAKVMMSRGYPITRELADNKLDSRDESIGSPGSLSDG
jgi:hypothetical protein